MSLPPGAQDCLSLPAAVFRLPEPRRTAQHAAGPAIATKDCDSAVVATPQLLGVRVQHRSRALDGREITVSGALLVPPGKAPKGGWPVVGWAHGTSGIIDGCAPSTIRNVNGKIDLYGYGPVLAPFISAGYAIAATDYEGLGTSGEHPFLIADSAGRSVIDAVHAARQAAPQLSRSWFAVGHSQGGHAVIAAGELAATWGRGLDFCGSVGIAPVTDVGATYNYGSPGPNERGFHLLVLTGLKTLHPELRLADYLGAQTRQMVPKIYQECMATMLPFFSQNFDDRLTDYQFTPQSPEAFFRLQPWLDVQSMPSRHATGPLLLLQGDRDILMKAHMTRQAVRKAGTFGTPAEFRLYRGSDHITVLFDAAPEILQWMKIHLRRKNTPCHPEARRRHSRCERTASRAPALLRGSPAGV